MKIYTNNSMRIFNSFTIIAAVLSGIGFSFAGREPIVAPPVKTKDLVRMSTHVVIGTINSFRVIESSTGQPVPKHGDALRPGQMFEIEIAPKDFLQQSDNVLSGKERLKVRFGLPQMDISLYRDQLLPKGAVIFFLCRSRSNPYLGDFIPFYGSINMWLPLGSELEVREWIQKFDNLK